MLLQFYFSNYRSFEGDTTLDMRASGSNELATHVRSVGNDKVLPIAAIYGANASGKSTVYLAFEFMSLYAVQSFYFSEDNKGKNIPDITHKPFAMSDSKDKPSEFEVYYVVSSGGRDKYFNYGFVLDKDGICEEWLRTNTKTGVFRNTDYKTVFYRQRNKEIQYNQNLKKFSQNIKISLDDRVLLVSLGAKLKVKELADVRNWFLSNEPIECSSFFYDGILSKTLPDGVVDEEETKSLLLNYMHSFDTSIVDFEFEKSLKSEEQKEDTYRVFAIHNYSNSDNKIRIPFEEESSGTIKMFSLYQVLVDVLKRGSILFADKLDIKLHPLLMRNILLTFADPQKNPNNAQLMFTTHNTIYMDMGLLRRDEIWFTEKNKNVSELYSLSDFVEPDGTKVRKDANYEKNYLLGNYGAVPQLFNLLGDRNNE